MLEVAEKQNVDIVTGNYMRMYPNERKEVRPFSHYTSKTAIERCFEKVIQHYGINYIGVPL